MKMLLRGILDVLKGCGIAQALESQHRCGWILFVDNNSAAKLRFDRLLYPGYGFSIEWIVDHDTRDQLNHFFSMNPTRYSLQNQLVKCSGEEILPYMFDEKTIALKDFRTKTIS
jgi:hypothetical protein